MIPEVQKDRTSKTVKKVQCVWIQPSDEKLFQHQQKPKVSKSAKFHKNLRKTELGSSWRLAKSFLLFQIDSWARIWDTIGYENW